MSKHEKQLKRQRRKAERGRRRSAATHGAAALAAAAAIAAGTSAYAEPIRYDNPTGPEHYDWPPTLDGVAGERLDITLPAADQPGTVGAPGTFNVGIITGGPSTLNAGIDSNLEIGGPYGLFTVGVGAGELIPSGASWGQFGYVYYPGYGSQLPEEEQIYLGARFDLGGGFQYGWIGVTRTGAELDAFAWGYETEVGVPIVAGVPEPGTLALLAMGAAGLIRRRRA